MAGGCAYICAMKLPDEVGVMTLPNVTLFPQALLPLYIFEPRYRQMLVDALESDRMFSVAMQRPRTKRETPAHVAGLGLIRVSVAHKDGTSHLILQGLARVELGDSVDGHPYRKHRIRALDTAPCDTVAADALLAKVRELLRERFQLGMPFPYPFMTKMKAGSKASQAPAVSAKDVLGYLDSINNPGQAADLVSCAVLAGARDRQTILEETDVHERLRSLIKFLVRDIRQFKKAKE